MSSALRGVHIHLCSLPEPQLLPLRLGRVLSTHGQHDEAPCRRDRLPHVHERPALARQRQQRARQDGAVRPVYVTHEDRRRGAALQQLHQGQLPPRCQLVGVTLRAQVTHRRPATACGCMCIRMQASPLTPHTHLRESRAVQRQNALRAAVPQPALRKRRDCHA